MPGMLKRLSIATAVVACVGAATLPSAAGADPVGDLLDGVNATVNDTLNSVDGLLGGGGGAPAPAPAAGVPPAYNPPAHGTNPHAGGTAVVADLTPEQTEPLPYDPGGGSEDVIVGGSRGEQNGDDYHGHVTIIALLGTELIEGADTAPGETSDGPLGDVNALLNDICTASAICLQALDVHSETTDTGSTNTFSVADANISLGGSNIVDAGVVESEGTISESGGCQTATGSSSVADAGLIGGAITADVIDSSSESRSCRNGTETVTQDSQAVGVGGTDILGLVGCTSGTPDTNGGIPVVLELVCGADDSSDAGGTQNDPPFGVREGITVFPLTVLGGVLKATTAASESQAVAPEGGDECPDPTNPDCPDDECPDPTNPDCPDGGDECPDPSNPDCPDGGDNGDCPDADDPDCPGSGISDRDGDGIADEDDACPDVPGPASNNGCPLDSSADDSDDTLAFTGADMGTLGAIGLGVMGVGLVLMALADRRRRAVRS